MALRSPSVESGAGPRALGSSGGSGIPRAVRTASGVGAVRSIAVGLPWRAPVHGIFRPFLCQGMPLKDLRGGEARVVCVSRMIRYLVGGSSRCLGGYPAFPVTPSTRPTGSSRGLAPTLRSAPPLITPVGEGGDLALVSDTGFIRLTHCENFFPRWQLAFLPGETRPQCERL